MTSNQKSSEKFYRLTSAEWLKACKELRAAEKDLLFYIKTLDPFNDGIDLVLSEAAIALGRNKGTISRALKVLVEKNWIDMEILKVRVKLKTSKHKRFGEPPTTENSPPPETESCVQTTELHTDNQVVSTQPELCTDNLSCVQTTEVVSTQPELCTDNFRGSEPLSDKDFKASKTYSDYLRLIQTLSDNEREKFLAFCTRRADELPKKVVMLEMWIHANFDWLKAQYMAETSRQPIPKTKTQPELSTETQSLLDEAIAAGKVKHVYYSEPMKHWMVVVESGQPMEVEYWLEKWGEKYVS